MKMRSLLTAVGLLLAVCAQAQQPAKGIIAEGGTTNDRASARVLYWNQKTNAAAGQIAINYGCPIWKKDYEDKAKFDAMTDGKIWRLGNNFWTTLVTDLPLTISGKHVPPGPYYLGLSRSADGSQWSLAFINPAGARKAHLDAFDINKAKIEFLAPMSTEKAGEPAEKLTITLTHPKDDIKNITLKIAWGNLALSAPIKVTLTD
ncbi:MAG TPA: DUF2911 domain-containing protein [Terriglobia bacterium]|nr:DUF2911 domain-containing protein [Terriglobia bacterium]